MRVRTGRFPHLDRMSAGHLPPLLVARGVHGSTGSPDRHVPPRDDPMALAGIGVEAGRAIPVDGQPVGVTLACSRGTFSPRGSSEEWVITLDSVPSIGTHRLQLQNPDGSLGNEVPLCVGSVAGCL